MIYIALDLLQDFKTIKELGILGDLERVGGKGGVLLIEEPRTGRSAVITPFSGVLCRSGQSGRA